MFQKRPTNHPDTSNDDVNAFIIGDEKLPHPDGMLLSD